MDVQSAEVIAQVCRAETTKRGGGVHSTQKDKCAYGAVGNGLGERSVLDGTGDWVFVAEPSRCRPLFEVEEDRIKAEKQEADCCCEPDERCIAKGLRVEEDSDIGPSLRLTDLVSGIWPSYGDSECRGNGDDGGDTASRVVEADLEHEVFCHHRVDETCDAGARRYDAYG